MDTTTPRFFRPDDPPAGPDDAFTGSPDDLLAHLAASDPGLAPEIADRLANDLEQRLNEVP